MPKLLHEQNEAIENLPRALPPPTAPPPPRPRRRLTLQKLCCIVCALFGTAVLTLCGLQKLDGVIQTGLLESITEILLESAPLGESIGETAFGSPRLPASPVISLPDTYLTLPRIYYMPGEDIIDNSIEKAKRLEKKMYELYSFDYSKVPSGAYAIVPSDLSAESDAEIKNDTTFDIDMAEITKATLMLEKETVTEEPLVLIVHTHGTESFSEEGSVCYGDDFNLPRSEDVSQNIVAVGKVLAETLNKSGIPTVHCETMHDKESYISAYDRSAESIQKYLEKYPSIRYVFDVHRDSLIRNDLTKLRPVTLHDEKPCAQLMMIVGSNEKSGIEYDWETNLVLAKAIQKELCDNTIGVARQLYLRGATYNQQYAKYGLLLEIGSCGNSLSEAKKAAEVFANAFAKIIK